MESRITPPATSRLPKNISRCSRAFHFGHFVFDNAPHLTRCAPIWGRFDLRCLTHMGPHLVKWGALSKTKCPKWNALRCSLCGCIEEFIIHIIFPKELFVSLSIRLSQLLKDRTIHITYTSVSKPSEYTILSQGNSHYWPCNKEIAHLLVHIYILCVFVGCRLYRGLQSIESKSNVSRCLWHKDEIAPPICIALASFLQSLFLQKTKATVTID